MRAVLKTGVSASLAWSGGAAVVGRITGKHRLPLVVGYHRVVEDFEAANRHAIDASLVSTRTLNRQLEWIGRHYEICSLDELDERADSRKGKGKPSAAITFDDGYADVYHNAMPLLLRKGMPFAVFAVTDIVGSRDLFFHDELYLRLTSLLDRPGESARQAARLLSEAGCRQAVSGICPDVPSDPYRLMRIILLALNRAEVGKVLEVLRRQTQLPESVLEQSRVLDWPMLQEMRRAGVVIGCHSRSHVILTKEDTDTVRDQVEGGRAVLEQRLGVPIEHFAYPDGAFNEGTVRAVARAGYRHAYTACFHQARMAPQLTIPRRMLWERSNVDALGRFSKSILACQVNGVFDSRSSCFATHA